MNKKPFLYKFASLLNSAPIDSNEARFDEDKQMNIFEDGSLSWKVTTKRYSNVYTSAHRVPAHRTPSNKWVPSKVVNGKWDRRVNK
ncbi:hypothetical protein [Succinivibrio dextrinosolvens]|uniref:Uncharacterized protein n=1 Tax=Succinivibrio dextrinosolvens TaxID=83771 RepID=A0A662Z9D5_9GAMM|nr:hypothetical protein [Succinivibrio dextrinosolvens]SFJ85093.1 hypothetical protein SAMN04487865_100479 [Succinivibrio dextrinosolvens]